MQSLDLILMIVAYFLGAIPFGMIVAKKAGIGDLRTQGSGNIGATNVARVGGKKLGAITLVLDGAKGALAVLLAKHYSGADIPIVCGMLAVLGHIFPVWLKFRGGKGVATTVAVFLAINWQVGLLVCATWILVFLFSKISSLSSIIAMMAAPTFTLLFTQDDFSLDVFITFFLAVVVVAKHQANIRRLLHGEESRIVR